MNFLAARQLTLVALHAYYQHGFLLLSFLCHLLHLCPRVVFLRFQFCLHLCLPLLLHLCQPLLLHLCLPLLLHLCLPLLLHLYMPLLLHLCLPLLLHLYLQLLIAGACAIDVVTSHILTNLMRILTPVPLCALFLV